MIPLLLLLALVQQPAQQETLHDKPIIETYTAKVIGISDGDTLTVLRGRNRIKIRLDSIDAPRVQATVWYQV